MKLYIYDHCPFCVRARMIFPLKSIPFEPVILLNDNEKDPINMVGQKMLPILEKDDGSYMAESLDIVHYIDSLDNKSVLIGETNPEISRWLEMVGRYVNKLTIPRIAKADLPEFATQSARNYFTQKKEKQIGAFAELENQQADLLNKINKDLISINPSIRSSEACNGTLSIDDILLFPILRGLTMVKGVNFPKEVAAYIEKMAQLANINLYTNVAS